MIRRPLPDMSIVLWFIREGQGWSQAKLGEASGVGESRIFDYETGRKGLRRPRLESLLSFMGVPPKTIDETLARLSANRAMSRVPLGGSGPSYRHEDRIESFALQTGQLASDYIRSVLSAATIEAEGRRARHQAEVAWLRLRRRTPEERLAVIEESPKLRTWALCERIAAESIELASQDLGEARSLAELAVRMAELMPGSAASRARIQGYAYAHLANIERVEGHLPKADRTLTKAKGLWDAGAGTDDGFLNGVWIVWIEATLRHVQQRFGEARRRIEEGLAQDTGELRPRLLYTKARILESMGDPAESTQLLRQAVSLVDLSEEPRFALGIKIQLLVNLCGQGFAAEAELGLPEVRQLAERVGRQADLIRVYWIEGRVAALLGRTEEARMLLGKVRSYFEARGVAYDYAVVSLELSVVLLQESRMSEVRTLALELVWVFNDQHLPANALAAIGIFREVAERERITLDFVRRVLAFLARAPHEPKSQFASGTEAGADAE